MFDAKALGSTHYARDYIYLNVLCIVSYTSFVHTVVKPFFNERITFYFKNHMFYRKPINIRIIQIQAMYRDTWKASIKKISLSSVLKQMEKKHLSTAFC